MKKLFLVLIGAMTVSALNAQVLEENEAALVYYSPKTAISVDFCYSVQTAERGIYAEFAEAMLGADQVVMENASTYSLRSAHISTVTSADYSRPHKVAAEAGVPLLLSINEKGVLKGYNLPAETDKPQSPKKDSNAKNPKNKPLTIAPFPEEVLEAATPLAQANAVAKQIFRLRETKMYLLCGEVEHAPADGKAMQLVLDELNKQEQELTELFVGKKSERIEHKRVTFMPTEKEQLWFFSEENGFTDAENIDADTIKVNMVLSPQTLKTAAENKKKKKGAEVSQIVYNLPGSGVVTVSFDGRTLGKRTVDIAQLGVDVPLSKELFTGATLPVILFNEKTGNVISISK